jgi:cellulose synthase/poly-beta-1,6-N-acetylglucosamine synthase-like glycosyltransferase
VLPWSGGAGSGVLAQPTARRRPDDEISHRRLVAEVWVSGAALLITVVAFTVFLLTLGTTLSERISSPLELLPAAAYLLIVSLLVYGALVYLVSRLGYMRRRARFRHAWLSELRRFNAGAEAQVTVLIPSYKEEPEVVRRTLLSAALQEYAHRRVVLLIDDPPHPSDPDDARLLAAARELAAEINALLARAAEPYVWAARRAERDAQRGQLDRREASEELIELHWRVAEWFLAQAERHESADHGSELFVEMNLRAPARSHAARANLLSERLMRHPDYPPEREILRSYRELASLFSVEVTSFERKRYANLSHAQNKAMNLNSYIALMGSRVAEKPFEGDWVIYASEGTAPGLEIPDADYILTLDADSLLEPRYTSRLVHLLEQDEHSRVAVAQTPYSAIPNPSRRIERIAGATTDIQYVIHQGFTAHRATYWVGANALLRKSALDDIAATVCDERTGIAFVQYIQDRTVIEDTESSVDLVRRGWDLFNYPARLSYSATPPDYGSLVVQRRRWANGGLLILPKLLQTFLRSSSRSGPIGAFMRVHYLVSIAAVNIGLLLLFLVPFAEWYANLCLPLACLPYFCLYAHDLRLAGYRASDLLKVYALNLMLIPVNLAGVAKSLRQGITGRQTPFLRTPKVQAHTGAPPMYVVLPCLLITLLAFAAVFYGINGRTLTAVAAGVNAVLLVYAVAAFIGRRATPMDF